MNKIKNLVSLAVPLFFLFTLLLFNSCKTTEEANNPCPEFDCRNGGELVVSTDFCACECPAGFTGDNCEIELADCTGVECPTGQEPNRAKDCLCE